MTLEHETCSPGLILKDIKGAIFDMDGTLIDSMGLWFSLGAEYLKLMGKEPRPDLLERLQKMTLGEAAKYIQDEYGVEKSVEDIIQGCSGLLKEAYAKTIPIKPGAKELLEGLRAKGIPMCVATATDSRLAELALTRLGIRDYFDFVLTCRDGSQSKRKPDIFYSLVEQLGTDPENTWVFEDAIHAVTNAKMAGLKVLAVYDDSAKTCVEEIRALADVYVSSLEEVKL